MTSFSARPDAKLSEPFAAGRIQWLRRYGDDGRPELAAGYWFVTPDDMPEPMTFELPCDETLCVIEGAIRFEVAGGDVHDLSEGDALSLNKGATLTVTILRPLVEFFVYTSS